MIQLKGLVKVYGQKHRAVDGIDLSIKQGQIFGFVGPNGAGKTTTIKMMTGILKPTEGSVSIAGYDLEKNPIAAKNNFGYVADNPNVFLKLRGLDYLNFVADMYEISSSIRKERINYYRDLLGLTDVLTDRIGSYSHGMKQKIMLIAALLHDPQVLILDEPMTGLDPQSSFVLKKLMKERAQAGKVVFFSTHVLELAEQLCDQIAIINQGKIAYQGPLNSLKASYPGASLEAIFLELTS